MRACVRLLAVGDVARYATVAPDDEVAVASADDFYSEGAVNINDEGNYANLDGADGDEFE